MLFETMIETWSIGGKKPRPIDILHMYGKGFPLGSTRHRVFNNHVRIAMRAKRINNEPLAILQEFNDDLRTYIWETVLQKQTRIEAQFEALQQGNLKHADFRILFEVKLQDMRESGIEIPREDTLYRKYSGKMNSDYRVHLLSKDWRIDGPDKPARKPMTYREIGRAVALLLEERQDIVASSTSSDQLMSLNDKVVSQAKQPDHGGGAANANKQKGEAIVCSYCHVADDHFVQGCPRKAAEVRGEYDNLMARYRASGLVCPICKTPGHEPKHHMQALNDYRDSHQTAGPGKAKTQQPPKNHKGQENQKGRPGKGSRSGKGAPAEAPCVVPPKFVRCE